MFHRHFLLAGFLALIVIVGLVAMGGAIGYRAGFSQAYMIQWLAQAGHEGAQAGSAATPPGLTPFGPGYFPGPFGYHPFLPGIGTFVLLGLLILLALGAMRAVAFHGWATANHPEWAARHGGRGFGPCGPFGWGHGPDQPGPSGEDTGKPKSPPESAGQAAG